MKGRHLTVQEIEGAARAVDILALEAHGRGAHDIAARLEGAAMIIRANADRSWAEKPAPPEAPRDDGRRL